VTIMPMRITKIQTRSWIWTVGLHRQDDERDQGHTRDPVGLEAVCRRADRVTRVVARAIRDDTGVAGVIFLDLEDDLHQVRADVAILVKIPPAILSAAAPRTHRWRSR